MQKIGLAIRYLRNEKGWSQVRLAQLSGVDVSTICTLEKEHRTPTVESLEKIARALKVSLSSIFRISERIEDGTLF
jgi:transcriptional regulator with XRE-family HTH domain